jgi:hypothetical protein
MKINDSYMKTVIVESKNKISAQIIALQNLIENKDIKNAIILEVRKIKTKEVK